MRKELLMLAVALMAMASCTTSKDSMTKGALRYCDKQIHKTLEELPKDYTMTPRNIGPTETKWNLRKVTKEEWTAGFWPGVLWYDYEATKDSGIREAAEKYTAPLEFLSHTPAYDHDLGFLVFCSYGNGYRLTHKKEYKDVIVNTADTLATLFNANVGTILSWPREVKNFGGHNTIIDNMINLEMLFWASKNGGGKHLWDVAVAHANTTMENHFRPDGSCYHVTVYDPVTGKRLRNCTHQGYSDESMWARGQGWAIYGYTMCYRYTKDKKYLDFAQKCADVYLQRLPKDMIPYWDFDDPRIPNAPRDASAAALIASGLLELSTYLPNDKGQGYRASAEKMLAELDKNYRCKNSAALLLHSTGHHPAGSEIDYSLIYADYYYMEALTRLERLESGQPVVD